MAWEARGRRPEGRVERLKRERPRKARELSIIEAKW